jgi:hypothetical protein
MVVGSRELVTKPLDATDCGAKPPGKRMEVHLYRELPRQWAGAKVIELADVDQVQAGDHIYAGISDDGIPRLVFRIFFDDDRPDSPFETAVLWQDCIAVGVGSKVFVIGMTHELRAAVTLDSYFSGFYPLEDMLLIASAERLYSVDTSGRVRRSKALLGIDGVVVNSVGADAIRGEGEWDPPGGWKPFCIRLSEFEPAS